TGATITRTASSPRKGTSWTAPRTASGSSGAPGARRRRRSSTATASKSSRDDRRSALAIRSGRRVHSYSLSPAIILKFHTGAAMCGIVGYTGPREAEPILIEGLRRLEYRGYDSSGLATLAGRRLNLRKRAGRIQNLVHLLQEKPAPGTAGISHTRWATHGPAN